MDEYGHLLPQTHHHVGRRLDKRVFEAAPKEISLPPSHLASPYVI